MKKIAVLIPVFNHLEFTKKCLQNLDSMLKASAVESHFPIVIVDDGSSDGTSDWIRKHFPKIELLQGTGNLWWSGGINKGARHALEKMKCDYVLLWNNDIQVDESYFLNCLKLIDSYDEGTILGSKIYANTERSTIWSMGGYFNPRNGKTGMHAYMVPESSIYQQAREVDWITGMGTVVPAHIIKTIGYWDAENFPQYHGDTEFTYRAKLNGFRNIISPDLVIWNDISNTGLSHQDRFRTLLKLLSDKRSLYNYRVNRTFLKKYGKGPLSHCHLLSRYFRLFGGFLKWKILGMFRMKREA